MTISPAATDRRRVRASERAFRIALKVMQDAGMPVDKVLITGGQIEIQCGSVEEKPLPKNHGGLKEW